MSSHDVLVVSNELGTQQGLATALANCGCTPIMANSIGEAVSILKRRGVELIFCSDEPPGQGIEEFIRRASRPPGGMKVVVVSRLDDWKRYIDFLQLGAFDYVLYPPNGDEIERVARAVLQRRGAATLKVAASAN